jgi:hypothetical protein
MTTFEDRSCDDSRCEINRKGVAHKISEHAKFERILMIEYKPLKHESKSKKIFGLFSISLLIIFFGYLSGLMYLNDESNAGIIFLLLTILFTVLFFLYLYKK